MPWIKQVGESEADGLLKQLFDAATERAGRVWNIVKSMSLNPPVLRDTMQLYLTALKGPSPLSRAQRELLATVVSAELHCRY